MTDATPGLARLPASFADTRESLRTLACYVIAPARKAVEGRIGLRSTGDGFGTPIMPDGTRLAVSGDQLGRGTATAPITSLAAAATFVGVTLSADPGVGSDLPPFDPGVALDVDIQASFALGAWYAFGQAALDRLAGGNPSQTWTEAQLWPEHFDLATEVTLAGAVAANVGFSPGDADHADPYVYVGPHDMSTVAGEYWNAPFGAVLGYDDLLGDARPIERTIDFVERGLGLLAGG